MQTDIKRVPTRLNIGCGHNRIDGYINIDRIDFENVDMVLDIRHNILPFADESVNEILLFHTIEHIEEKYHRAIFKEFYRILEPEGCLFMSYPEFRICAEFYINNYKGMQEFWKHTIYGLQREAGDYHVSLMDTEFLVDLLQNCGFEDISYISEKNEKWNTVLSCVKMTGIPPDERYEENLSKI